ncbi:MAG: sulfurtransferase TusA family protein [Rhodospirillales bacterium]|nr:sulfurtransferase TusA family protein [Rhodospirillales bacterium]
MADLDTSGLKCPLPVIKAKKALGDLGPGEALRVTATDPSTKTDFPDYCANAGHELVETSEADGIFVYLIRKGS